MTNLELLDAATKGLDPHQKRVFENYFLGAISHLAKKEDWEKALATAARCIGSQLEVSRG